MLDTGPVAPDVLSGLGVSEPVAATITIYDVDRAVNSSRTVDRYDSTLRSAARVGTARDRPENVDDRASRIRVF